MRPARPQALRPRIAIVGANFAGLAAARQLGREYAVTVFDRSASFEWLPNIHELLSGVKRKADLRLPLRRLVTRAGHRFVRAEVTAIDAAAGQLSTTTGRRFGFDLCIVAVGGADETYGVRGADRHAMPFKSVDNCAAIGRELATLARKRGHRSVVIVGGGLEGVEALGEILRRYARLDGLAITLVEAGPRLLPGTPFRLDAAVRAHCEGRNVRILTDSPVTAVTPKQVRLRGGATIRSDLTLWTGGVTAPPLLHEAGLADKPRQWAPVTAALRSKRFDNVFVIGDAAALPRPIAKQAYYALQMGSAAAANVRRALAGRTLRDFKPAAKPMLVAFGDLDTFLVSGRSVIASPGLAALKEAVFQVTMAEIDPPLNASALGQMTGRLRTAATQLAVPTIRRLLKTQRLG
ncbi:MAG TPA: FAD-dependent oxidoreductase [Steroidobacteraceae bacterium]|jgi:NADH dehydrogenase FAD-containing subunit|nr:FAD-dependent oxidoreductase [Steroidobacteraceae bacterium]